MKTLLTVVAGFLLSVLLIAILIRYSGLTTADLGTLLKRPNLPELLGIVVASIAHMACGALKWRAIVTRLAPKQTANAGHMFFIFYTTLSAALAQFVMVHIASLLVRGFAGRIHHKVPFVHGAAASVFEQMFDVYVLLVFAAAGITGWLFSLPPVAWIGVVVTAVVTGVLLLLITVALLRRHSRALPRHSRIGNWITACLEMGLIERTLVLRLYLFSVLRYMSMLGRTALIVAATAPAISLFDSTLGFTIVQSSQLIALTPGSLGITEWTWTGMLSLMGYPPATATAFSFALRILSYASILVVLAIAALLFAVEIRIPRRSSDCST